MEYTQKKSILSKRETFQLDEKYLTVIKEDRTERLSLSSIAEVRLQVIPASRYQPQHYRCIIQFVFGVKIIIDSLICKGFAEFENQYESYAAWVRRLHELLKPHKKNILFNIGVSTFQYFIFAIVFFLVGVGSIGLGIFFLLEEPVLGWILLPLSGIYVFAMILILCAAIDVNCAKAHK